MEKVGQEGRKELVEGLRDLNVYHFPKFWIPSEVKEWVC